MTAARPSDLARKLNLREGVRIRVVGRPEGVALDGLDVSDGGEAVLVFVRTLAEVDAVAAPMVEAALRDALAWIAYPKAGQLGTDLNRDVLWRHLQGRGVQPVRQVALDDVWSAMRFRPAK